MSTAPLWIDALHKECQPTAGLTQKYHRSFYDKVVVLRSVQMKDWLTVTNKASKLKFTLICKRLSFASYTI